jgi:hypothetical protein
LKTAQPYGGLDRTAAIHAARQHLTPGGGDPSSESVISADVRQDFDTGFGLPRHRWSWVVNFRGNWALACTGACVATSEWVAVDYYTGDWIASQHSYRPTR